MPKDNKKVKTDKEMTEKEKLFVEYYNSNGNNAALAVRQAGFECKEENARHYGFELLKRPHIQRKLKEATVREAHKNTIGKGDLLEMYTEIALANKSKNPILAMSAMNELKKSMGLSIERQEITQVNANVELSSEEAEEYLKSLGLDPDSI